MYNYKHSPAPATATDDQRTNQTTVQVLVGREITSVCECLCVYVCVSAHMCVLAYLGNIHSGVVCWHRALLLLCGWSCFLCDVPVVGVSLTWERHYRLFFKVLNPIVHYIVVPGFFNLGSIFTCFGVWMNNRNIQFRKLIQPWNRLQ